MASFRVNFYFPALALNLLAQWETDLAQFIYAKFIPTQLKHNHGLSSNGTHDFCAWHMLIIPCPLAENSWKVNSCHLAFVYLLIYTKMCTCFSVKYLICITLNVKYCRWSSKYVKIVKQSLCFVPGTSPMIPCPSVKMCSNSISEIRVRVVSLCQA